jgi:hypothetical protein
LWIAEAENGSPLQIYLNRAVHFLESLFGEQAVMADLFRLEQTAVGLEADCPQRRQVAQTLADIEIPCVVDGGFGAQGAALFVVLLDARFLVADMQRGNHSIGDHPRAKRPRGASGNSTVEDQLHLLRASHTQVFTHHFPRRKSAR